MKDSISSSRAIPKEPWDVWKEWRKKDLTLVFLLQRPSNRPSIHPLRSIGHQRANSFFSRLKSLAPRRRESFSFRHKNKRRGGKIRRRADALYTILVQWWKKSRRESVKVRWSRKGVWGWKVESEVKLPHCECVQKRKILSLSLKVLNSTVQQLCPWLRSSYDQLFFRFQSYVVQQKMILSLLIWRSSHSIVLSPSGSRPAFFHPLRCIVQWGELRLLPIFI